MAQHRDAAESRCFLFARERAAELRPDAEDIEQLRAHPRTIVSLGLLGATDVDRPNVERGDAREAALLRPVVVEVVDRDRHALDAARRILSLDRYELVGIGEGHALEKSAVDDAEHRGREADAEREGEHGDSRERAALPQRSSSVPNVSKNGLHGGRG
jgi:hypothetical protein